jgi:hypothetical protein
MPAITMLMYPLCAHHGYLSLTGVSASKQMRKSRQAPGKPVNKGFPKGCPVFIEYVSGEINERFDYVPDTGTLKVAPDTLLEALLAETPNPMLQRLANHDSVALLHIFHGIPHPAAVQQLLNLKDFDMQVLYSCRYCPCQAPSTLSCIAQHTACQIQRSW